ncbi:tripartite tricarboxylate transporter substrate-binding protein [Roseateles sp. LKC17W]|uniref:Tripartite tricarboxylate transporter substrate-binding protein n=1 Tax=Pelomonas margarita TaxID=3299031 RepID=A0ABW7FPE6_9BURK
MGRFAREVSSLMAPHYTPPLVAESQTIGGPLRFVDAIRKAPPDGSLLMHSQNSLVTLTPQLAPNKGGYDPLKDLTPIAALADFTWVLVVAPHVDAKVLTVKDYLAWVTDNPESRSYGVTQFGSIPHLMGTMLARRAGASIRPVSYASSDSIRRDLMGQSLAAAIVPVDALRTTDAMRLRPLAVVGKQRWPTIPDVPTFAEAGFRDLEVTGWYVWAGPAGLAPAVHKRLVEGLDKALADTDFAGIPALANVIGNLVTGDALLERLRRESQYFASLTQEMRFSTAT